MIGDSTKVLAEHVARGLIHTLSPEELDTVCSEKSIREYQEEINEQDWKIKDLEKEIVGLNRQIADLKSKLDQAIETSYTMMDIVLNRYKYKK